MEKNTLIFAEDPGAANYLSYFPGLLTEIQTKGVVLASVKARHYFEKRETDLRHAEAFSSAEEAIDTFDPELILVGTSENRESMGLSLIQEAKRRKIQSVGVVDMGMNAAFRFRGQTANPLAYAPDRLIVPDPWTFDEFSSLGYPGDRIHVCGHPHYDFVLEAGVQFAVEGRRKMKARMFPGAPEKTTVAVFAAELSDGLNAGQFFRSEDYTLEGFSGSGKRTDIVIEELLGAVKELDRRPYLVLRLHPKNEITEFAPFLKEFDQVSSSGSALELIYAADCVIGMTSMLLLEAALMGVPTLSILPRKAELQWLPTIGTGLTRAVTTRPQLFDILPAFLDGHGTGKNAVGLADVFVFDARARLLAALRKFYKTGASISAGKPEERDDR